MFVGNYKLLNVDKAGKLAQPSNLSDQKTKDILMIAFHVFKLPNE
jgi:hypothetical protein